MRTLWMGILAILVMSAGPIAAWFIAHEPPACSISKSASLPDFRAYRAGCP